MARGAKLSILGLYSWDSKLFDNLQIPTQIDKNLLISRLLMRTADLIALYPDADVMKQMIGYWSKSRVQAWQKMADVLYEDYDPFVNIKRDEERTVTTNRDLANSYNTRVNSFDDQSDDGTPQSSGVGTDTGTITTHEKYHLEGDSAITDAQDVARKEIVLRQTFNLIDIIIEDFRFEFCLSIY